ncbi:MAG: UDP-3-O-[3-hydroxymyristoyl] N-acetylglucosamine deacetylase [Deltaproteobacteria bacterium]|nr:MAG: UDP-3-O-[3-hydroxymyristoyl] N-acetylglucosamine deacetylase [Deltaproteobacteria bacterium]
MYFVEVKEGNQRTIRKPVLIEGIGLHTGHPSRARLEPAPPNTGIVIIHLDSGKIFPARSSSVVDTSFATVIGDGNGAKVSTVEHFLASLYAMGVDNALVKVTGPEMPILDGSALHIAERLGPENVVDQDAPRTVYAYVGEPHTVSYKDSFITISPDDELVLDLSIDFPEPIIGKQRLALPITPEIFLTSIAPARTFTRKSDIEYLWSHNLALGGSLENAVVVDGDRVLNEGGLIFPDEFVRHKILDFIGDISLLGVRIRGRVRAHKPGHTVNSLFTKELENLLTRKDATVA